VRETPVGAVEIINSWIRIRQKPKIYVAFFYSTLFTIYFPNLGIILIKNL